jgi:hypothetical protein
MSVSYPADGAGNAFGCGRDAGRGCLRASAHGPEEVLLPILRDLLPERRSLCIGRHEVDAPVHTRQPDLGDRLRERSNVRVIPRVAWVALNDIWFVPKKSFSVSTIDELRQL